MRWRCFVNQGVYRKHRHHRHDRHGVLPCEWFLRLSSDHSAAWFHSIVNEQCGFFPSSGSRRERRFFKVETKFLRFFSFFVSDFGVGHFEPPHFAPPKWSGWFSPRPHFPGFVGWFKVIHPSFLLRQSSLWVTPLSSFSLPVQQRWFSPQVVGNENGVFITVNEKFSKIFHYSFRFLVWVILTHTTFLSFESDFPPQVVASEKRKNRHFFWNFFLILIFQRTDWVIFLLKW